MISAALQLAACNVWDLERMVAEVCLGKSAQSAQGSVSGASPATAGIGSS